MNMNGWLPEIQMFISRSQVRSISIPFSGRASCFGQEEREDLQNLRVLCHGFLHKSARRGDEGVRSSLVGAATHVPEDHSLLYEASAARLREEATEGVAQSETIASILRISLAGLAHFMRYFSCPFRLFCDPRESKEDAAVLDAINDFFGSNEGSSAK